MNLSRLILTGLFAAGLPFARAGIVFEKCVNVTKAPNFWYQPILSSDTAILGFDEAQGVVVPAGRLASQRLNRWDDIATLDLKPVGAAKVNSHMIYFDKATKAKGRVTLTAEVEFDGPIIGVEADDRLFARSNPLFAPNATHKKAPGDAPWSLEEAASWTPLDRVTFLSPTRIRLEWTNESATDPLRVFTVAPTPPTRLLFAGSSSVYWNDLPREVARVVDRQVGGFLGSEIMPETVGRSFSDIRVYSEPGFKAYEYGVKPGQTFLEKIRDERPPLVVLMVVTMFIMDPKNVTAAGDNAHADAVTRYCTAIRAAGGEPAFYEMGWGKGEEARAGRRKLLELAASNRIRVFVPCSTAWERVYAERPALKLQHPKDGAHPGDAGHFLNLACFYAALTEQSPVGRLPRTYPVWPHALPKPQTAEEKAAEAARVAAFRPDAYQMRMAKWMYRNMSMNLTATLDEPTAAYLETVAWETWQATNAKLADSARH